MKAIWIFGIDRNVQLTVGYQDYGAYQALLNLALIFQIVLDFGLTQYCSKTIAAQPARIGELLSSMLWARLFLGIFYLLIVFLVARFLGYQGFQFELLFGVLGIMVLNSLMVFLRSNVAALHYFKTDGVLAVVDRLLMIVICGLLLFIPNWAAHFKIQWFVWSQIISYALAVIAAIIVLVKISPERLRFGFNFKLIKQVLASSAPFALLVFLMSVYMRSDSVMIERLCGKDGTMQAGIYASAFRLLDVANIFGVMFAGMLMPIFSRMFAQGENVAATIRTSVDIMMPIAFVVAIAAVFFNTEIMQFLYHRHSVAGDARIFAILMCSFPAYCLMYIYSTLLTAKGSIALLNKISAFIVLVNLSLLYWLVTDFMAIGAAWAVLGTEWVVAAMVIYFAHHQCQLPHDFRWLGKHLLFVMSLVLVAAFIQWVPINWMFQLIVYAFCSFLLLYILGLWSVQNIKSLMNNKAA